ncbi:hypothetical protein [Brevundimonas sp.]|uniref:hypothetical protein n=1 Tax=Brevundimonas sp. TaxID=1871086 RepID=UPI003F72CBD1
MELEPFESPKLVLGGAKESIADFEAACASFVKAPGYTVIRRMDGKTGEEVVSARFEGSALGTVRLSAYRVVNQLRDALDQATSDAAKALGLTNVANVHFPMGRSSDDLERAISYRLKGADPDLVAFVRALRPYLGGNDELWALGRISGPNKHQRVLAIGLDNDAGFRIGGDDIHIVGPAKLGVGTWNSSRNELELVRVGAGGYYYDGVTPALTVKIGDAEVFGGKPAAACFHHLAGVVEGVVAGLEAETARIIAARAA